MSKTTFTIKFGGGVGPGSIREILYNVIIFHAVQLRLIFKNVILDPLR